MIGCQNIEIRNNRSVYHLSFERNISVITGASATGKTTLVDLIRNYDLYGSSSGIMIKSEKRCMVLDNAEWKLILSNTQDSIVFIDEGREYINTPEFAKAIKESDNYYVIITRENLYNLPLSVEAIYGLHGRRYFNLKRTYNSLYKIYPEQLNDTVIDRVITEDSNAGFQFFRELFSKKLIPCSPANGNSNLLPMLKTIGSESVLVIADGAAFGPYMQMITDYQKRTGDKVVLYLPESFEWIILSSGLLDNAEVEKILQAPYDYIDSGKYFSWERFFTALLIDKAQNSYLHYSKTKLNSAYLQEHEKRALLYVLPEKIRRLLIE